MPVISMFYGIIVHMFNNDNRKHHKPHIHVEYQDYSAVVEIDTVIYCRVTFRSGLKDFFMRGWRFTKMNSMLTGSWQSMVNILLKYAHWIEVNFMLKINNIKLLGNYTIEVSFDNGENRICDISPFLENGDFKELKEITMFNTVRSIKWGIEWANGLDLSADTLEMIVKPANQPAAIR